MTETEMPVAGVDYPRTHQELLKWFPDDEACLEYLAGLRWPSGFVCPNCGGMEAWRIARRGMWMCRQCGKQTSVTAGTIFHRSRTPLSTWFAAIWFVCASKNGVSASALQHILGFGSYETAWAWLHKLRRAMVRPDRELLAGTVELDVTMVGGRTAGKKGASTHKVPVMVAVEVGDKKQIGRIRLGVATKPSSGEPVEFAERVVRAGSHIRTDGAAPLRRLTTKGFTHEPHVMISAKKPAHEIMPGVHIVSSLLKRWISGTLHHGIATRQLEYYLDEYTFRFNRRHAKSRGLLFYRLLQQAVATDPQPLTSLFRGTKRF